jgi:ribosomal protein S18 acetylase RimI-like enzyme/SAM-dependent methyltransferase
MTDIAIEPLAPADAGELLTLQRAAYQTEAAIYGDPGLPPLVQTLGELRAELEDALALKAVRAGRLVGAVRARLDGDTAHVARLVVAPDVQGRGLGTRLLAAIEAAAAAVGARRAELFTGHRSAANLRLYRRLGYTERRREPVDAGLELVFCDKELAAAAPRAPRRDPALDYDRHGAGYARTRRTDPRIAARVHAALGDARTVANVGAGAGSYEPADRHVLAFEPSATMRAQRPRELAPAVAATAEALPLDDDAVDAAMAMVTVHHWGDPHRGLRELRRVARGPVVVLTFDPVALASSWLFEYLPEALADDQSRFMPIDDVAATLGAARVEPIALAHDCRDGLVEAFYGRPEAFLDPAVRRGQSIWPRLPPGVEERAVAALAADLESGAWDARHGALRTQPEYPSALRLVVGRP